MKKILKNEAVILAALLCFTLSCQNVSDKPVEKDGKFYGVTKSVFSDRWWDYYERGLSFADGEFWQEAEKDFREALKMWDTDHFRTRTYGRHLMDYFPHRELGISLFYQKRYSEAIQELEISLSSEKSAKAEYYLDKTRKLRIEQNHLDSDPPEILIDPPEPISNRFSVTIRGNATDDTFVKEIQVNGSPIRIDLSAPRIRFEKKVPIIPGENPITVQVRDLSGKLTQITRKVLCDRTGPILSIEEPEISEDGNYLIRGYALDDSGIREIRINDRIIPANASREFVLNYPLGLSSEKIIVIAEDIAGNQTQAEIAKPSYRSSDIPKLSASLVSDTRGIVTTEKTIKEYRNIGNYYALIIGINRYHEWKPLETAVNDALALKDILIGRYGFEEKNITMLTDNNARWENIIGQMKKMACGLREHDNFLIYFAGHGESDHLTGDGYWIPVEGHKEDRSTWITNSAVRNIVGAETVRGKNILVIADSCYSGTLLQEISPTPADDKAILIASSRGNPSDQSTPAANSGDYTQKVVELAMKKSRQIIASGGIEPVSDTDGKSNHSLFATYFLKALKDNTDNVVDIELLYNLVWQSVVKKGRQRPVMGRLKAADDQNGQFVLIVKTENVRNHRASDSDSASDCEIFSPDNVAPTVEIKNRSNTQTVFTDHDWLEIHAYDKSGIQNIRINGQKISKRPGKNLHLDFLTPLIEGDNEFKIECFDQLGNRTEKKIIITMEKPKIFKTRMSLAVFPFRIIGNPGTPAEDFLFDSLYTSKRFDMKKKASAITASQADNETAAVRLANEVHADMVLTGTITVNTKSLTIQSYVIDRQSSDVIATPSVFEEDIANPELIRKLCRILTIKLCDEFPLLEGKIVDIEDKTVFINLGEEKRIKKGMQVIFFEEGQPKKDPDTGKILGTTPKELGIARIQEVLEKMSSAKPFDTDCLPKLKTGQKLVTK